MTIYTFSHPQTLLDSSLLSEADDPTIVVADVMFFSTTTTILGEQGVETVIPIQSVEEARSYSEIPCGGEFRHEEFSVDFQNRPQSAFGFLGMQETIPEQVTLHSTNGARVLRQLNSETTTDAEILIGCFRNLQAVADHIESVESSSPIFLVSAGSREHIAVEDQLCISCLDQYLGERPVDEESISELTQTLPLQRYSPEETNIDSYFQDDDRQHAARINESSCVPRLDESGTITFC